MKKTKKRAQEITACRTQQNTINTNDQSFPGYDASYDTRSGKLVAIFLRLLRITRDFTRQLTQTHPGRDSRTTLQYTVTTNYLLTNCDSPDRKIPDFSMTLLDEIVGNMSNKCTFINPNSP